MSHESEPILFDAAKRKILEMGLNPDSLNMDILKANYDSISNEVSDAKKSYRRLNAEIMRTAKKKEEMEKFLDIERKENNMQPASKKKYENAK